MEVKVSEKTYRVLENWRRYLAWKYGGRPTMDDVIRYFINQLAGDSPPYGVHWRFPSIQQN